jgi:serine phosphatase RsbU (regulator of sigma subunit)
MTVEDSRPEPLTLLDPIALAELLAAFEPRPARPSLALFTRREAFVAGRAEWPAAALRALRSALAGGADEISGGKEFRAVPLRIRGETAGALLAASPLRDAILRPLHRSLTVLLGQALELRDAADEQLADRRRADLFYRLGETIGATLDLDQIAGPLTVVAQRATGAEAGALLLYPSDERADERANELVLQASVGDPARVADLVAAARQMVRGSAGGDGPGAAAASGSPANRPILTAPVGSGDLPLGVLALGRAPGSAPFGANEERLIGALASGVGIEKARYHRRELQRQRQEHELAIGRRIQLSLLPRAAPRMPGWEFHATYRAAREVGGDFYDFIAVPGDAGLLGVTIGDVTGKGVPAALMMATTRILLRNGATSSAGPAEVIAAANRQIVADNRSGLFATVLQARLELASGQVTVANAGHEPPILVRAAGGRARRLAAGGSLLGLFRSVTPPEMRISLAAGDMLVLYTDGVTDARNPRRGLFGERRLLAAIRAARGRPADEVGSAIVAAVDAFSAGAPQFDDLTLVVVRRTGTPRKVS